LLVAGRVDDLGVRAAFCWICLTVGDHGWPFKVGEQFMSPTINRTP
jgi:hypothetical protein